MTDKIIQEYIQKLAELSNFEAESKKQYEEILEDVATTRNRLRLKLKDMVSNIHNVEYNTLTEETMIIFNGSICGNDIESLVNALGSTDWSVQTSFNQLMLCFK